VDGVRHPSGEDHAESKRALRAEFTASRRARDADSIASARVAVREVLFARWGQDVPRRVAGYVPLGTEPGSVELLDELVRHGSTVLVPVVLEDNDLDWRVWREDESATGTRETMGPETLSPAAIGTVDLVLVPALAVARDGTRLGRGGGSYDRALSRVAAGCPVVALLFEDEVVAHLPRASWDRPVTAIVTPDGWRELDEPSV
jgi:5-formyltetrahydrofolate cyclo-ligase